VDLGPSEQRLAKVIKELLELTRAGKIGWSDAGKYAFAYTSSIATVFIESVDQDGIAPFRFTLLNPDGVELESLSINPRKDYYSDDEEAIMEDLGELYDLARRDALSIDRTIDRFMNELKDIESGKAARSQPTQFDDEPPF
jgi:hypothetical protein